jgi:hypothetical protein
MANSTKVWTVTYDHTTESLGISISGYPNEIIERAHKISESILGDAPWAFEQIKLQNPTEWASQNQQDSEWLGVITAYRKKFPSELVTR